MKGEKRVRRVSEYLTTRVRRGEVLHFSLIDPDKVEDLRWVKDVGRELRDAGTDAFLVGGSLGISESDVDSVVTALKEFNIPVILFPGNVSGISRYADAILFMSLLNSDDPYFIIGAQVLGAPIVAKYGLEALPTAYIVVGYGGAAGFVGRARPLPYEKPELAAAYAKAAEMLGMKYIYLEAGSGAPKPVPPELVKLTRKALNNSILIVGGGIRKPEQAEEIARSGANIIVTGTVIETDTEATKEIIKAIKKAGNQPL